MAAINPYVLSNRAIMDRSKYFGRAKQFNDLYSRMHLAQNIVILGPQGTGKTQFLNCALNREKRNELIADGIYVSKLYNGISHDANEFFDAVASSLIDDADIFLDANSRRTYDALQRKAQALRTNEDSGQARLSAICKFFQDYGYTAYVVIDCFEQFVNSRHITKEHHDNLRSFLQNNPLRLVVTTDFDFNKSTLPRNAAGSLLLQLFSSNEITLPGLSLEESSRFLYSLAGRHDFSDEELRFLHNYSGGIPQLLCHCAYYAYSQKEGSAPISLEGWKYMLNSVLESDRALFENWAKHLDETEVLLLRDRAKDGILPAINPDAWGSAVRDLVKRGLLSDYSSDSTSKFRDTYPLSSVLFKRYCNNPDNKLESYVEDLEVETIIYEHRFPDIQELIRWIANPGQATLPVNDFRMLLGNALTNDYRRILESTPLPERGTESDFEYELIRDEHLSAMGSKMLPAVIVDDDTGVIIDVNPQELATFDERFNAVRHRRPALTDEILHSQSNLCQLYLKLSVIVEDALSVVDFMMSDYSPQLILYGKTLEQSLRDNLYPFFHSDPVISTWDTYKKENLPKSKDVFKSLSKNKSYIGSYIYMLKGKAKDGIRDEGKRDYIIQKCVEYKIQFDGGSKDSTEWKDWWNSLRDSTAKAKIIRDKVSHSGKLAPIKQDLDNMCTHLFGSEETPGLLTRLKIGAELASHANNAGTPNPPHSC